MELILNRHNNPLVEKFNSILVSPSFYAKFKFLLELMNAFIHLLYVYRRQSYNFQNQVGIYYRR